MLSGPDQKSDRSSLASNPDGLPVTKKRHGGFTITRAEKPVNSIPKARVFKQTKNGHGYHAAVPNSVSIHTSDDVNGFQTRLQIREKFCPTGQEEAMNAVHRSLIMDFS
jgi:hypothetical protein